MELQKINFSIFAGLFLTRCVTFRTPSQSPVRPVIRAQSASPARTHKSPAPQMNFRPPSAPRAQAPIPPAPTPSGPLPAGSSRPRFTRPLGQLPMTEGDPITLECMFEGKPTPQIIWSRHGQVIKDGNRY